MGCGKSRDINDICIAIPHISSPSSAIPEHTLLTSTDENIVGKEAIAFAYLNGYTNSLLDIPVKLNNGSYSLFKHVVYCKTMNDTVDSILGGVCMIRIGRREGISNEGTAVIPISKVESSYSTPAGARYMLPSLNEKVHSEGLYVGQEIIKYCGSVMMLEFLVSKLIETTAGKTHRITQHMSLQYRNDNSADYDIILRDDLEKVAFLLSTIKNERDLIHIGKTIYCPYLRKSSKTSPRKSHRLEVEDYRSQLRRLSRSTSSLLPTIAKEDTESWTAGIRSQNTETESSNWDG